MSVSQVFSLIGDSNVQRNMNSISCRDRPLMSGAQVIPCGQISVLAEALRQVRQTSNVTVLSCITNFMTRSDESVSSVSLRVEPIIKNFKSILDDASQLNPECLYLVAPPMYRHFPIWYRDGLSEVMQKFSSIMSHKLEGQANVHLLPSFPTPAFEQDGVHLTPFSGLEFILHLFDSASSLITTLKSTPESLVIQNVESSRVLEDRMMALEQDHRRLNRFVEDKSAEDAELADYQENIRYESYFVVLGLPHIAKCDTKVWQERAKKLVGDFLLELMDREIRVVFVKNISGKGKESPARYQVQVESVSISKEIRDKFGTFFPKSKDCRPPSFKKISVRNRLTHETRVRLNIMRVLAEHWLKSNPGSRIQVIGYESRPTIRLLPSEKASDRRILTFNFIEAVRSLPVSFSPDELDTILGEVKPKWQGKLKSLFIVLTDDMFPSKFKGKGKGKPPSGQKDRSSTSQKDKSAPTSAESSTSRSRSQKRGPSPEADKNSKHAKN